MFFWTKISSNIGGNPYLPTYGYVMECILFTFLLTKRKKDLSKSSFTLWKVVLMVSKMSSFVSFHASFHPVRNATGRSRWKSENFKSRFPLFFTCETQPWLLKLSSLPFVESLDFGRKKDLYFGQVESLRGRKKLNIPASENRRLVGMQNKHSLLKISLWFISYGLIALLFCDRECI